MSISPPAVYEVANPAAHKTSKIIQIVQSIFLLLAHASLQERVQSGGPSYMGTACQPALPDRECHWRRVQNLHLIPAVAAGRLPAGGAGVRYRPICRHLALAVQPSRRSSNTLARGVSGPDSTQDPRRGCHGANQTKRWNASGICPCGTYSSC